MEAEIETSPRRSGNPQPSEPGPTRRSRNHRLGCWRVGQTAYRFVHSPEALEAFQDTFEGTAGSAAVSDPPSEPEHLDVKVAVITTQYMEYIELMQVLSRTGRRVSADGCDAGRNSVADAAAATRGG